MEGIHLSSFLEPSTILGTGVTPHSRKDLALGLLELRA
jgi:hypothetical protein